MGPLTKDVNHDHDRVEPMRLRKLDDEVHRDGVPELVQDFGRMKLTVGESPKHLRLVVWLHASQVPTY
jgi:hypothetical protein